MNNVSKVNAKTEKYKINKKYWSVTEYVKASAGTGNGVVGKISII